MKDRAYLINLDEQNSGVAKLVIWGVSLQVVVLSWNFAWTLIRHVGFDKCPGIISPDPYGHIWTCPIQSPGP